MVLKEDESVVSEEEHPWRTVARASPASRSLATCVFVDDFPMTVTGKIQKYKMRETEIDKRSPDGRRRHSLRRTMWQL